MNWVPVYISVSVSVSVSASASASVSVSVSASVYCVVQLNLGLSTCWFAYLNTLEFHFWFCLFVFETTIHI